MSNPIPSQTPPQPPPSLPHSDRGGTKGGKKAARWKIGQVPPPAPAKNPPLHINVGREELTIMIEYAHATAIYELREYGVVMRWQWIHTETEIVFRRDPGKAAIPIEEKTLIICTSTPYLLWGAEVWLGLVAEAMAHPKYWLNKEKKQREALAKVEAHVLPIAV